MSLARRFGPRRDAETRGAWRDAPRPAARRREEQRDGENDAHLRPERTGAASRPPPASRHRPKRRLNERAEVVLEGAVAVVGLEPTTYGL